VHPEHAAPLIEIPGSAQFHTLKNLLQRLQSFTVVDAETDEFVVMFEKCPVDLYWDTSSTDQGLAGGDITELDFLDWRGRTGAALTLDEFFDRQGIKISDDDTACAGTS
jgi:hypothetical protein